MKMLLCLWALPTWLITNLLSPVLPKDHPWKGRWFPLYDWAIKRTPLTEQFDLVLWVSGLFAVFFIYYVRAI